MLREEDKELRDSGDNFDSCIMVESQDRLLTIVLVMKAKMQIMLSLPHY
jgi:hypothetical protein